MVRYTIREKEVSTKIATYYFLLLGGGSLVSWNAILNSLDYFGHKFPNNSVTFTFPVAVYLAQFLSSLVVTKLSDRLPLNMRIIGTFTVISIVLAILPIEASLLADTELGFLIMLGLLFILGTCNNICMSSLTGLSSQLPGQYSAYIFLGTSICGLSLSLLREFSTIVFKSESAASSNLGVIFFFGVAAVYIIGCIVLQTVFMRSEFYKKYLQHEKMGMIDSDHESSLVQSETDFGETEELPKNFATFFKVFREVKFTTVLLMISCIQLFAVYPGVILKKPMPDIDADDKVIFVNLVFNVAQTVGKLLGKYRKYYTPGSVFAVVMLRFALIAIILLQAITTKIPLVNTIWFGFLTTGLYGFIHGFLVVALTILGPERVSSEKKEVVGHVAVFGINVGVLLGTFTALPFKNITPDAIDLFNSN